MGVVIDPPLFTSENATGFAEFDASALNGSNVCDFPDGSSERNSRAATGPVFQSGSGRQAISASCNYAFRVSSMLDRTT